MRQGSGRLRMPGVRQRAKRRRRGAAEKRVRRPVPPADLRRDRSGGGRDCGGRSRSGDRPRHSGRPRQQRRRRRAGALARVEGGRVRPADRGQPYRAARRDSGLRAAPRRRSLPRRTTGTDRHDLVGRRTQRAAVPRRLQRVQVRPRRPVGIVAARTDAVRRRRGRRRARRRGDADLGEVGRGGSGIRRQPPMRRRSGNAPATCCRPAARDCRRRRSRKR